MPYRSFNPTNSSVVPTYVGNSLAEYEKLFKQKQQQFDVVQEGMMNVGDAAGGVQAIAKDDQFAKELYNNTQAELAEMAKQGDYENMLPRVSKLARKFAQDAKPLAERYQQRASYMTDLKKKYDEGKISSDQFKLAMTASDNMDRGMQRDPITGRLQGSYSGMRTIDAPDYAKLADEAMKNYKASSGENVEIASNGVYYIKTKNGREEIRPDQIRNIVSNYMMASKDYQNYMSNVGELVDGANMPLYQQLAADPNKMKKLVDSLPDMEIIEKKNVTKTVKGKKVTVQEDVKKKVSAAEYIKSQGLDPIQFIRQTQLNQERDKGMATALNYAVPKYTMIKTTQDITMTEDALSREARAKSAKEQEDKNKVIQFGTVGYSGVSAQGLTPEQADANIQLAKQANEQTAAEFNKLFKEGDETYTGVMKVNGKWMKKNRATGELVNAEDLRDKFRETEVVKRIYQDGVKAIEQLKSDFKINNIPASVKQEAEKAKQEAIADAIKDNKLSSIKKESLPFTDEQIQKKGEDAYKAIMRSQQNYKEFEKALAEKTRYKPVSSTLVTTTDEPTLKALSGAVDGLIAGLGDNSALNVRYYSGQNDKWGESTISKKDYAALAGKLDVVGMSLVNSGSGMALVVRAKPGAENVVKGKAGDNMLIEIDANMIDVIARSNPAVRDMFKDAAYVNSQLSNLGGTAYIRGIKFETKEDKNGARYYDVKREGGNGIEAKHGTFTDISKALLEMAN